MLEIKQQRLQQELALGNKVHLDSELKTLYDYYLTIGYNKAINDIKELDYEQYTDTIQTIR